MSLLSDLVVEQRRLRRNMFVWRAISAFAILLFVGALLGKGGMLDRGTYVGLLTVEGVIVEDRTRARAINALLKDPDLAALIIYVNSPGGSSAASESLYRSLRGLADEKPVVTVMGGVAASGGYMVALAADRIFARESTVTGSIGVVLEVTNFVELMRMAGIGHETLRSGPLKAQPNPLEPISQEGREMSQALVEDVHQMFRNIVSERRNLHGKQLDDIADGRVFSGASAHEEGLIDAIGGIIEARAWLRDTYNISDREAEREIKTSRSGGLSKWLSTLFLGRSDLAGRLALDGLVSVWHPSIGSAE
ncbi:MAG: signal peptide peptidase SppA [Pseudomonadota bacterium]|nr:signal peptide peptidase SppA [Pseudomonadota bacterium]